MSFSVACRLTAQSLKPWRALHSKSKYAGSKPLWQSDALGVLHRFVPARSNIAYVSERLSSLAAQQHPFDLHFAPPFVPRDRYDLRAHSSVTYPLKSFQYTRLRGLLITELADASVLQMMGREKRRQLESKLDVPIVPLKAQSWVSPNGRRLDQRPRMTLIQVPSLEAAEETLRELEQVPLESLGPLVADGFVLRNHDTQTETEFPFLGKRSESS